MKRRNLIATAILSLASLLASAEQGDSVVLRPINSAVTLDLGKTRNLDTYLSPIRYEGMHIGIGYEYFRSAKFSPKKWKHNVKASLTYDKTANPMGNNTMHTLLFNTSWGMMFRKDNVWTKGLNLYGGGMVGFDGGVTYNPRNSNNVCSPHIYLYAGLTGMATYGFRLWKLPMTVRYQPSIPVIGGYYLPDYDQTFYEIYLGNYRDTMNFGWWGNRFDMENLITVDLHLGSASLRIGYRNNFTTLWKNNISVQRSVHALVVGIAWEAVFINPQKGIPQKAKTISALY